MGEVFLDRYEAEHEVGQGGMAVVYRGVDRVLHRPVAIKVLHPHLSRKPEARARFAREARVIAKLRHPNVVEVYDFAGEDSDRSFIVAEFVEGESLSAFLKEHGPLLPEIAALVAAAIGRALHHAHERGVIHRDVKPENIMVRRDGVLKLMDFGIAHVMDMEHLTMTGAIIGSPAHMSPEQVDGHALDARTDVFSLGTLLYLMASGRYPFSADNPSALLKAIAEARTPDVRTLVPGFADDLFRVLRRMMARDPAARFASAAEVSDSLEQALASVGMRSGAAEAARYFVDPTGYTAAAGVGLAAARLGRAAALLKERRHALAIRELDVVLATDRGNEEACRLLARARRAARRRRLSRTSIVVAAGVGMALGATLIALKLLMPGTPEPSEAPAAVLLPEVTPRVADAMPGLQGRRGPVAVPAVRNHAARVAMAIPVPTSSGPATLPVVIQADPPAVRITVDGRDSGVGSTGEVRLVAGRHSVALSHPSCDMCRDVQYSFTLDPSNPPRRPLRFSIGYRDAMLTVTGPAGATVSVNGVPRGQTNQPLAVPMQRPSPETFTITTRGEGRPPRTARVVLEPGRSAVLALP